MTETIAPPGSPVAESPHIPRPETDSAALRAIDEATAHVRERALKIRENPEQHKPKLVLSQQIDILNGQDRVLAILDNFASKDMPGRQRHIQDCVDQILAKVDSGTAEG
jgi:hypothetical protein